MKMKVNIKSKCEDKILASLSITSTSLIGFVGKESTSLDSEVDEEQEMTKSKKEKFVEEEKIEREKRRPNQGEMTTSSLHKRRVVNILVRGKMVILCKV
jgi:hypothetical protein